MAKKNFYAVKIGRTPGIYRTWAECEEQVKSFPGAVFKGFGLEREAKAFLHGNAVISAAVTSTALVSPKDHQVTAYVDGSYEEELQHYSHGMVIFHNGEEKHFSASGDNAELLAMRNVAGEILGAQAAMQYCIDNGVETLKLCYDYQGIEKWCKGEWRANKPGTQAYKAFYDSVKDRLAVTFVKIAAHTGDKYNELADTLAKQALYAC
jgi:ribonuclease HI